MKQVLHVNTCYNPFDVSSRASMNYFDMDIDQLTQEIILAKKHPLAIYRENGCCNN